jgi:hypothetical protein
MFSFAALLIVARRSERIRDKVKAGGAEMEKQGRGEESKNLPGMSRQDGSDSGIL